MKRTLPEQNRRPRPVEARKPRGLPVQPWAAMPWPDRSPRIPDVKPVYRYQLRALIVCSVVSLGAFLAWLLHPERIGDPVVYWPLTAVTILMFLGWLLQWLNYWNVQAPDPRTPRDDWTVDVLTTACPGEPREMIARTLLAMTKIRYPHKSYLCDEGNDPLLKELCDELGVIHVTRTEHTGAKAGNINHALQQCTGEICVILDPDHEPAPDMLDRTLGYFDDSKVGFVQSMQGYRNQGESWIARGAAEQTYHFYGPIMMGMNGLGTAQVIGANCVFRRAALDSIGGHAEGLAEDMHTAMRLFAEKWRSVYVPETLTRGLVPSTLGAYYKQQLKWSCGVFDLLFGVYPKIARNFSLWQKLQYSLAPIYFLRGLIVLIGILVPSLCLIYGWMPWKFEPLSLLWWGGPLVIFSILLHQAAQHWVLDDSERGFHMRGGLLMTGTWWVHLVGVLCSCLRVKVPYIPTPKDGEVKDNWILALPNLIVGVFCAWVVFYGLQRDFTPFSIVMALLTGWHAVALVAVALLGQQRSRQRIRRSTMPLKRKLRPVYAAHDRWRLFSMQTLRTASLLAACFAVALLFSCRYLIHYEPPGASHELPWTFLVKERDTGGFYTGMYVPTWEIHEAADAVGEIEKKMGLDVNIISVYQTWGPKNIEEFPEEGLRAIYRRGAIPLLTWEPWTDRFEWPEHRTDLRENRRLFANILEGVFDEFLVAYATRIRDLGEPILLRFAHEMDNPQYPWSHVGDNTPQEFVKAWQYVVEVFHAVGAGNVGWVWSPWGTDKLDEYYPETESQHYVDWIGVTTLNYGWAYPGARWRDVRSLYHEFHEWREEKKIDRPVIMAEFGTTAYGGDQIEWLQENLPRVRRDYPEVKALVFFHSSGDANWPSPWRPTGGAEYIDWTFAHREGAGETLQKSLGDIPEPTTTRWPLAKGGILWGDRRPAPELGAYIQGGPGQFELLVDGAPFYVKGVAYNPGHDWRDAKVVPTRRQLEEDFERIRQLGGNTIRRYGKSIYDHNILTVAAEKDLKVIYGFYIEQDIDFVTDTDRMAEIEAQVVQTVLRYRDDPAILAWCIGNEVWGILRLSFAQPYLTRVRQAYVLFIERLARRIKHLDPNHMVFVSHESSDQVNSAVLDFARGAPALDANGINCYYEHDLKHLNRTYITHEYNRPYLVSEFGHDGYWLGFGIAGGDMSVIRELTAAEKGDEYGKRWGDYVSGHKGTNLGGVAYCWRQRFEATSTWFGLTTLEGHPTPSYLSLREAWTGQVAPSGPRIVSLEAPLEATQGATVRVTAQVTGGDGATTSWRFLGPNFQKMDIDLEPSAPDDVTEPTLELRMPDEPGVYRVYLQVEGGTGLDQANQPIKVLPETPQTTVSKYPTQPAVPSRATGG